MADLKLKRNLDWNADHLVSQLVTNTYHSNRKQELDSQTVKSGITVAVVFQCKNGENYFFFSKKQSMGTFKIYQSISNIIFYFLNSLFFKGKACSTKTILKYFYFQLFGFFSFSELYLSSKYIFLNDLVGITPHTEYMNFITMLTSVFLLNSILHLIF